MALPDIYTEGIASGWKVIDAATLTAPQTIEADVAIIGSGAGGGLAAEILSLAGLKVLLLEEGPLKTSDSFKDMDEAARLQRPVPGGRPHVRRSDGAIAVLQGRSVGGSTTVNWTSSFRTPEPTLKFWAAEREVVGHSVEEMKPWFEKMEQRLNVAPWAALPNANNSVLEARLRQAGLGGACHPAQRQGLLEHGLLRLRLPGQRQAVDARLDHSRSRCRTARPWCTACACAQLQHADGKITGAVGEALGKDGRTATGVTVTIKAKHYVAAGGALNTPALLLRSRAARPAQAPRQAHADPPGRAHDGRPCRSPSTPSTARRSRSRRTTSSGRTAPPGPWATSSRCRRCSRVSAAATFNVFGEDLQQGMAAFRTPTRARAAARRLRAAERGRHACAWATTATRCSTTT